MTRPLSTTMTGRGSFRAALTAMALALAAGPVLATAAEAGNCGRGGGYRMSSSYRSVARTEVRQSKAAEKRAAEAKPAHKVAVVKAADDKAPDARIAEKVPGNTAASATAPASEGKSTEAKKATVATAEKPEAVVEAPVTKAEAPVDCKRYVPSAGVTISVPCGK